jgi:hypothetical protein
VKSAEPVEDGSIKEHEHSGAKGLYQHGTVLGNVVGEIEKVIAQSAVVATDVCGNTMKISSLGERD